MGTLKYLAFQFGPDTFGLLTQVMAVAAIFYMFAGGGITNGLIRNIAAAPSDHDSRRWMWAGTTFTVVSSFVLAAVAIMVAALGGGAIFGDASYGWVYVAIAVTQVVVGCGNLVYAIFSANGDHRSFAKVQIIGNILSLLLLVALIQVAGLVGAATALILAPAMTGVVALLQLLRQGGSRHMLRIAWEPPLLKNLLSYALAMVCAVTAVPLAQILIRLDMSERLGWSVVGYWQSIVKLSDAYMLFIGVIFIHYLLPKLSRQKVSSDIFRMMLGFGASILPMFVLGCTAIYLVRDHLILAVYSEDFLPASNLVLPQLIGDTLRIAALVPHYYFMSQGRILVVIVSELTQGIFLYALYLIFVPLYAAMAPVYSHAATYSLLLILMTGFLLMSRVRSSS